MLKLYDLTIEYKHEPLGLDEVQPRFSWKLESDKQDTVQAAYRLALNCGGKTVWDSDRVESEQSILNEYLGPNLTPRTGYTWTVTVWDNHGETGETASRFETGLLSGSAFEGKAQWITHTLDKTSPVSPVLYKDFVVTGTVKKARLYATALGMYEAQVNGEPVDDTYFHPGWTNYRKRLQYQTYAVTLHSGKNRVALTLANGWYKGKLGFMPQPNNYGDTTAALAALCITYEDGREEWLGTDESWLCTTGAVQFSEIYDGETQDFTAAPAAPQSAKLFDYGFDTIIGQENEPVRCLQKLPVVRKFTAPNGEHLFDFGQNLTGWVEVEIYGDKGQKLTLHHAESLDENGKHDLAGKLLLQEDDPSWLYEVKMGATTIWERWNSIRPDGSFNPANMNSLNHYSYGSIGNWLYTKLCGLEILEPGYKRFALRPQFVTGITHAALEYESVYGKIAIAWRCEGGKITVDVTVPANTTAVLTLPESDETLTLGSGSYHYEYATETSLEIDRYTMETPMHTIMEHPVARAIFQQYAPEFLENPMLEYVRDEPITALLAYGESMRPLFEQVLAAMNQVDKQ